MTQSAFRTDGVRLEAVPTQVAVSPLDKLQHSLSDHKICFVVPLGSTIDAFTIDLPGGILILGALRGRVICQAGSAIVAAGGEFQGDLSADDIYVEGRVTSPSDEKHKSDEKGKGLSKLKARGSLRSGHLTGGLVALGEGSSVLAIITSRAMQVALGAQMGNSRLHTLD